MSFALGWCCGVCSRVGVATSSPVEDPAQQVRICMVWCGSRLEQHRESGSFCEFSKVLIRERDKSGRDAKCIRSSASGYSSVRVGNLQRVSADDVEANTARCGCTKFLAFCDTKFRKSSDGNVGVSQSSRVLQAHRICKLQTSFTFEGKDQLQLDRGGSFTCICAATVAKGLGRIDHFVSRYTN
jgi:hypothetical protein